MLKRVRKSMAAVLLISGIGAAGFYGSTLVKDVQFVRAEQRVKATREQLSSIEDLSTVFREVGRVVEPSVVNINVRKTIKPPSRPPIPDDMLRRFFRDGAPGDNGPDDNTPDEPGSGGQEFEQMGTGSGVIMEADGDDAYVLTNNHVAGGASEMVVTLSDGRKIEGAKLLGADAKSDLAVVKIHADRLIPAKWGDSDTLEKGDWVMAFGSPFGYIGSMTHGIVSALNRQAGILGNQGYESFVQVDAPINPGNSGGPLVNVHGEVVGINTAIASRSGGFQGIGFAIPSNQAKFVYNALKSKGKVTRGWLGIGIRDVSAQPGLAKTFGYQGDKGVLVENILAGNTPAQGKLQPGDIITSMQGKPVNNVQQLRNIVAATSPGSELPVTVFRKGQPTDVSIKIGEQPDDLTTVLGRSGTLPRQPGKAGATEALGMSLQTPTEELIKQFGLGDEREGALVTSVQPRSASARAGLQRGDLITHVGDQRVKNAQETVDAIKKQDPKQGVRMYVTNAEGSHFVFVKPEEAAP